MIRLNMYGWNDRLNQLKQESAYNTLSHGRIAIVHRTCYEVVSESGLYQCELTGNMMYGNLTLNCPVQVIGYCFSHSTIAKALSSVCCPVNGLYTAKRNGTVAGKQAIASYVDKAFIVQSLDDNFNMRRVERFMVQILEENIHPVLILNKADLPFDKQGQRKQSGTLPVGCRCFSQSIHHPETVSRLQDSISEGETVVFVGSSGVGKSSLVNALCERSVLLTSDISQSTGKGAAYFHPAEKWS